MLIVAVWLAGCASIGRQPALTQKFDPAAAAFVNAQGRASVSGQAFVRQTNGKLLRAVGTDILLVPRTAYSDERVAALYGDGDTLRWGVRVPEAEPLYEQYVRKTVASSGGSFRFDHVADGGYYIVAMIFLPGEYIAHEFPILERVTVAGGKSVRVVMRGY
jgi:hypothetical protein